MLLAGKTVWITGASRGIGQATAIACAQQGARVVLSARTEGGLAGTVETVHKIAGDATVLVMDVSDKDSIKAAFQRYHKEIRRLDVLVNNAGILRDALLGMITEQQIEEIMRTNLYGAIHLIQYASRLMTAQAGGSIVNIASIIGRTGNAGQVVYSASKAALIGATKSAARELASKNIRVNAIAPGVIQTAMISNIPAEKLSELKRSIHMQRLGTPEEVAQVAVFLGSEMSSYVTGQTIGVDGGMWL